MSSIQVAGLSSGVDWTTLITQIVNADRVPETAMRNEQSTIASKLGAFTSLKGQFKELQTAMTALQSRSLFSAHSTTLSNTTLGWSATAGSNTPNSTYSMAVTQLATAAARQGAGGVGRGLSATSDVSGVTVATMPTATAVTAGNFQVNGAQVAVVATDSLQDVFAKISTATGGAVTGSYDPATDKVSLQSSNGSPVVLGASNDTSNFLTALKLSNNGTGSVSSAGNLGSTQLNKPLAQAHLNAPIGNTDADGNGSLQINGVAVSYNVNTDSMQTVLSRINASSAGVTAAYDVSTDRFTVTNKTTGDLGMALSETSGGLLDAMGLGGSAATVTGRDAHYSINGGADTVSHTNAFTDAGSGLSITAATTGTQNITVGSDNSGATAAINSFVSAFNKIQTAIAAQTKISVGADNKVSAALFAGNREVSSLGSGLRQLAFSPVSSQSSGAVARLQDIGVDFASGSSNLTIKDPTKLANALATKGSDVANLFQNSTDGLTKQLGDFVAKTTGESGTIATQTATLNKRTSSITNQIAALERKLTAEQNALTLSFTAMERAQATIKAQSTTLTNAFTKNNSSS